MTPWVLIILIALSAPAAASAAQPEARAASVQPPHLAHLDSLMTASRYDDVITEAQALQPLDTRDEANILDRITAAAARSRRVNDDAFRDLAARAVALKTDLFGPDAPATGISLQHQGNLLVRRWELDEALAAFERAAAIFAAAGNDHARDHALALVGQGLVKKRMGERHESAQLNRQALAIQEANLPADDPDIASTLNNLGTVSTELGDYSLTLACHQRALAIREAAFGPDHEWVAESLNNLATVLGYLGRYEEALDAQEKAVRIIGDRLGPDHRRTWLVRFNLAIVYQDMGDYEGSIPICEDVLARSRERNGDDTADNCYFLDALGAAFYKLGRYDEALARYTESLAIAEALYGQGNLDTAETIAQQGHCLAALGRLDEAADRLEQSLAIRTAAVAGDNAGLCDLLNQLADLHLRRGDWARAAAYAARCRAIGERELGRDHPYLSRALLLQGRAARGLGRPDEALDLALAAEQAGRRHLQTTMGVLSESRALDYAASRTTGLDLACSQLADGERGARVAKVWDQVIRSRSLVLDAFARRHRDLHREDDPAVQALADSARVLRERLANLTLRGAGWEEPDEYTAMLRAAEADFEQVERRLALASRRAGRDQALEQTGFADVGAAVPAGWALVAYAAYQRLGAGGDAAASTPSYLAFVLPASGGEPLVCDLGPAAPIDAAVERWRWEIRYGAESADRHRGIVQVSGDTGARLDAYKQAAGALRALVWDPVAAAAGGAEGLFLVPAGQLALVSFPALVDRQGRYLVEQDRLLHLLPDERTLALPPAAGAAGRSLLAVGGADFGPAPAGAAAPEFCPLPETRTEVDRIAAIWYEGGGTPTLLLGADASEAAVKDRAAGHAVLHLATHGFFQAPEAGGALGRWNQALTHSGLALAGANAGVGTGGEDGILTAQEVAALDLSGAAWAVLSACETGLGTVDLRGEGVHGLRRAFDLAGAHTVIMSLWAVPDAGTRLWMENLYTLHWRDGWTTARAVREATLRCLAQRRAQGLSDHPFSWGGFVASGDWR